MSDIVRLWHSSQVYLASILIVITAVWVGYGYGLDYIPLIMKSSVVIVFAALVPFSLGLIIHFLTKKISIFLVVSSSLFVATAILWPFFTELRSIQINIDNELAKMRQSIIDGSEYNIEAIPGNLKDKRDLLHSINQRIVKTYETDRQYISVLQTLFTGKFFSNNELVSPHGRVAAIESLEKLNENRQHHFEYYKQYWHKPNEDFEKLSEHSLSLKEKIGQWNIRIPYILKTQKKMHDDTKEVIKLYKDLIEHCDIEQCTYDRYSGMLTSKSGSSASFEKNELKEKLYKIQFMLDDLKQSVIRFEDAKFKAHRWLLFSGL